MFIAFILILLAGLAGFVFVFTGALKGAQGAVPLRSFDAPAPALSLETSSSADTGALTGFSDAAGADEARIAKLEQMIDEKNAIIAELQEKIRSGLDHDAQVDSLKQILQGQIEELKQNNRQLKAENGRLAQENLDLQARVFAGGTARELPAEQLQVIPAASTADVPVLSVVTGDAGAASAEVQGPAGTLSLHDVFGGEAEDKNS